LAAELLYVVEREKSIRFPVAVVAIGENLSFTFGIVVVRAQCFGLRCLSTYPETSMTTNLILLIKVSVFGLILAIGMRARWTDLLYLWQRPGLLVRSLLAMYVVVPLTAFALVKLLAMTSGAKAALIVLAASGGAPLLPRRLARLGEGVYAFSLVVSSSLIAMIVVPLWLELFTVHFGVALEIHVLDVAKVVAQTFLLPLIIGMVLRGGFPIVSGFLANRVLDLAGIVLLLCGVALLAINWQVLLLIQGPGLLALITMMIVAIATGHWLGGPDTENRNVLAIACATRHIGVALVVATTFPKVRTVVVLIAYVFLAALISALYLNYANRRQARII
jgi:bile acid:Na+ symporter, BASS family